MSATPTMMTVFYVSLFLSLMLSSFQLFALSTYGFGVNDALLGAFYLYTAKRMIWDGEPLRYNLNLSLWALLGLIPAILLSGITPMIEGGGGVMQYAKTTAHFLYVWLFAVIAAGKQEKPETVTAVMRAFLIAGGLVAAFGIYQVIARALNLPLAWIEMTNVSLSMRNAVDGDAATQQLALQFQNFYRATSIFSEPSLLASFTSYFLIFLGIPYLQSNRMLWSSSTANWLIFLVYIGALFLTFSLTGILGVVIVCSMVFLLERGKRIWKIVYGAVIIVVCLSIVDVLVAPITKISVLELFGRRIIGIIEYGSNPYGEHTTGESFVSRAESITLSADVWELYPVNGVGLGRFAHAEPARRADVWFSVSSYSSILAETGTIGFFALILFLASVLIAVLYWYKRRHEFPEELSRLLGIMPYMFILFLFLNFTGNNFVGAAFWQWLGLIFLVLNAARRHSNMPFVDVYLVRTPLRDIVVSAVGLAACNNRARSTPGC